MNITRGPLGTSGGETRAAMYLLPCRKFDQKRQKPPVKDLVYDDQQRMLRGISCTVAGDPSQLRIYVPDGFSAKCAESSNVRAPTLKTHGNLLTVDYMSSTGKDVE